MKVAQFYKNLDIINKKINLQVIPADKENGIKKNYGFPKGYPKYTEEDIKKHNENKEQFNSFLLYLKGTGLIVLDCDDKNSIDLIESWKLNTPYTKTTKGRHYYIRCNEDIPKIIKIKGELDIITDYICENTKNEMYNYDEIIGNIATFTKDELYKKLEYEEPPAYNKMEKQIKKIEDKFSKDIPVVEDAEIEKLTPVMIDDILSHLIPDNYSTHDKWFNFLVAMYNQDNGIDQLRKLNNFSKRLSNYKEEYDMENMKTWMSIQPGTYPHNSSWFYKALKNDNYEFFKKLMKETRKEFCPEYFKKLITLEKKKEYFEKYCWKILTSCKPVFYFYNSKLDDFKEYTEEGLKSTYKHLKHTIEGKQIKFMDIWTDAENIKLYNDVDFLPTPLNDDGRYYKYFNLYTGLRAEKDLKDTPAGGIDKILKHIYYLCGEDETNTDYMLDLLAHRVKYPGIRPQVAVVMRSPQGSGKNLLFDWFGNYILGKKYYICSANPDSFLGRFNCGLKNKLLCVMNEVSGGDTFGKGGRLKEFITEPVIEYEAKGVNKIYINNCALLLFFTNHEQPLEIEHTDRRFVVFDCSKTTITLKKEGYFIDLVEDMKDETIQKAFYDFLMNREIESNHDFQGKRPQTTAYLHMKEWSIPPIIKFCKWYYENGSDSDFHNVKSNKLYNRFLEFKEETRVKSELSSFQFTNKLKKYNDVFVSKRTAGGSNLLDIDEDKLQELIYSYFPEY